VDQVVPGTGARGVRVVAGVAVLDPPPEHALTTSVAARARAVTRARGEVGIIGTSDNLAWATGDFHETAIKES
jgi:hypothetical protein